MGKSMLFTQEEINDLKGLSMSLYTGEIDTFSTVQKGEDTIRETINKLCGGEFNYYTFKDNQWKVFEIMSEVLSVATKELVGTQFDQFIETRDTQLGDTIEFFVENTSLFNVSVIADGTNDIRRQRLTNGKLNVTTFKLAVKIYEEFDKFMAGRVNWSAVVQKVAKSFQVEIGKIAFKSIIDAYVSANSSLTAGTFDEEKLAEMIAKVSMDTGSDDIVIYGTKKALRKIKAKEVSEEMKNERHGLGYVKMFEGTPCVELPQCVDASGKLVVQDDHLIIVPNGEKLVKLVFEGQPLVYENTDGTVRNDQQVEYSFMRKIGLAVLKANTYGLMKLA